MARHLLLISGSLRHGSTNAAALATVAAAVPDDIEVDLYDGVAALPHFNPDDDVDPLPAPVADLRRRIAAADAVLLSTPEYAGALPGSFKNLLDWTVGGMEKAAKPVAWINVAARPGGAAGAHESLRTVLTWADWRVVDDACTWVPVPRELVGDDGVVHDAPTREALAAAVATLMAASGPPAP